MKRNLIKYIMVAMALVMTLGACQKAEAVQSTIEKLADETGFTAMFSKLSDFEADTAGGSLKVAAMAEELMRFTNNYTPEQETALKAAADVVLSKLDAAKVQAISDNLGLLDGVAQEILSKADGVDDLMKDAGVKLQEGGYDAEKYAAVKKVLDDAIAKALKK